MKRKTSRLLSILLALCMALALLPGTAWAAAAGDLTLYGDAQLLDGDVIELTSLDTWKSGSAWMERKITTTSGFTASFSYWAGGGRDYAYGGADGIVLVFSEEQGLGSDGGYLGFVGNNAYGVELDSYPSNTNDPNGKHLGVVYGSTENHIETVLDDRVDDSEWHDLTVAYSDGVIDVYLDGDTVLSYDGIDMPGNVYVGISASTGSGMNRHLIKDLNVDLNAKEPSESDSWINHIDLPEYASDFYDTLADAASGEGLGTYLVEDGSFIVDPNADASYTGQPAQVVSVSTLTIDETPVFAGDGIIFDPGYFAGKYTEVDVTKGDTCIDYASLKEGDLVQTSTFNGIFVTKIPSDDFAAKRAEISAYIKAAHDVFDRDHPEIFWLNGAYGLQMPEVTIGGGTKERFFFFVLANKDGFSVRSDEYKTQGAIDEGIAQRDAAVQTILATVDTAAGRYSQVKALNKWLTEHNAYNSSADLTAIGNNPHECLVALTGTVGTAGPVCDGYSRAFKVLCDELGIPCLLVQGYAKTSADDAGGLHMWNNVQMEDGKWYGVDVTWNDPTVSGQASIAISGHESEDYLLVGSGTENRGLAFAVSHSESNLSAVEGISLSSGLQLSPTAYSPNVPSGISVTVKGKAVEWTDAAPFIDSNNRTMVPLRAVAEALGLDVTWSNAAREAGFTGGTKTIWFPINSSTARTSDGSPVEMDTAAVIVNSRTYAPIRYLAEYFGYTVGWNGATRTVIIQ